MLYPENEPDQEVIGGYWWLASHQEWLPKPVLEDGTKWITIWTEERRSTKRPSLEPLKWVDDKYAIPDPDFVEASRSDPGRIDAPDRMIKVPVSPADLPLRHVPWDVEIDVVADASWRLRLQIFHSTNTIGLWQGAALRDKDGALRPEMQQWPDKFVKLPDLSLHGYEPSQIPGGMQCIVLHCMHSLIKSPGNLRWRIDVLAAGETWVRKESGKSKFRPHFDALNADFV